MANNFKSFTKVVGNTQTQIDVNLDKIALIFQKDVWVLHRKQPK